jgi:hypothetical protein
VPPYDLLRDISKLGDRIRALETGAHITPSRRDSGWGRNIDWSELTPRTGATIDGTVQVRVRSDIVTLRTQDGTGITAQPSDHWIFSLPLFARPSSPVFLASGGGILKIGTLGDVRLWTGSLPTLVACEFSIG